MFRVPGSRFAFGFLGSVSAAVLFASAAVAQPRPFTLDDIAAFKSITDVAVSPDGRVAVFAVKSTILGENRTQVDLWSVSTDGATPARELTHDKAAESALRWSPDGKRVAFLADRDGSRQVWALPVDGGEAVKLTTHAESVAAFDWSPDGKQLAIVAAPGKTEEEKRRARDKDDGYFIDEQWRNHRVWIVTTGSNATPRELTDGKLHVRSIAWSPDARRLAMSVAPNAEADASEDAKAQVIDVESGRAQDVPGGDLAGSLTWSPDGRRLAFARAFDGKGISREDLYVWDAGTTTPARNLSSTLDRDVEDLFWTSDGRSIEVKISQGATHSLVRIDADGARVAPPRRLAFSVGPTASSGTALVFARTDRPAELQAIDASGDIRQLTVINKGAASQVQLPSVEAVRWKGPIGEVEGVLYKPFGYDAKRRYPLLVNPHGGPRGHSNLDFDAAAAYWTSLGYVVLKPNFRGSTGYGDAFTKANVEDWGAGPFADVMTGVDDLIARGVADADRLFMFGWSYGGIMANWTATHTDRFKAIVSGASVADARLQYSISDSRRWRFDYFKGSPFIDANYALYQRESAVTHVKNAKSPTLFVVGSEDKRCPIEQSLMMYRAFKDHGVTTDLLIYPREDHGFVEPRHIVDRAKRVAEWFRRFDTKNSKPTTSSGF